MNSGRGAEDQTKALNDSLEKQKNLTDSLAQSFESLADSIAQSAMSAESFSGKQLDKQLADIKKQQQELREEELYRLSPDVNSARASQNVADKKIKAATTEADMLAAQGEMSRAKADEERAKSEVRARATQGVGSPEAISAIVSSFRSEAARVAMLERHALGGGGDVPTAADITQEFAIAARMADKFLADNAGAGGDAAVLRRRMAEVGDKDTQFVSLSRALALVELPLKASADEIAVAVSRASSEAASKIKEAQDQVAEAIKAGAPGAAMFGVTLGKTAESLVSAQDKIIAAVNETDPSRRRPMVDAAKRDVEVITQTIDQQLAASRGMMFGGLGVKGGKGGQLTGLRRVEGAGSVLAALEGSEEFGGRGGASAAALRGLIAREVAARSDFGRSMTFGNDAQRGQAALRLEQAQEQLQRFTDGLPEQIKSASDAVKAATKQSGRDEKNRAEMLERGRDLLISPKNRAIASFRKDLEAATLAAGGPGGAGVAEFVKANLAEAAPMVAQMANERAAAISPPYYSALQASDTSTMEGQRELNRLLRGEDASKDKNLDELKTQSDLLRDLIAIAKQNGIIVDL
jgi:hypothetical protein